ncbi:MAG: peptide MFS transporter [Alistipes sp.]|jgi:POT family proton-dependent oligopeptide transporter|nr:peptide MFS transporter [Alistipes sp.]
MFKGHPKGLFALALANTGERFGYYTMLAIFLLFLQAKFGFSAAQAGQYYGIFLACVYFLPLVGGILADKFGYGKMVTMGIVVMFLGYLFMSLPVQGDWALAALIGALLLISIGTGLFKGNLQVMVGNLYDAPEYREKRDSAFSIFYMAINIGAMFAPSAATAIVNWRMKTAAHSFTYDADIPTLARTLLDKGEGMATESLERLGTLAANQGWADTSVESLRAFAETYLQTLGTSYHMGFAVACVSLVLSIAIYLGCKKWFKHADVTNKQQVASKAASGEKTVELTPMQVRSRIVALCLVFVVVIFFWMSFHQNGLTLTLFARDYTQKIAEGVTRIGFDILSLTFLVVTVYGLFGLFQSKQARAKLISGAVVVAAIGALVARYLTLEATTTVEPQLFQHFNPFFVVVLTPVSMAIFNTLARMRKEPSTPRKIGMGMIIAALGFVVMAVASIGLASPAAVTAGAEAARVSANWLIGTYLVLTFGELLLSPMGISFVSKVAPPKYKGAMMGLWFAATAIGNYLTNVIAGIWDTGMELWMIWSVLIAVCLLSAMFIFSIIKRLDKATADV